MELVKVNSDRKRSGDSHSSVIISEVQADVKQQMQPIKSRSPFIEANTEEIELSCLEQDCIIPVFSKDNERTIAHQEFISMGMEQLFKIFPDESIGNPEIRVSHQIKGRVPEAIYKSAKELLPHERTQYYERMAFAVRINSITSNINGNELVLMAGGVRAYNQENLYAKKNIEKFKFFIGFQNLVCCNMCVSSDGLADEIRASSIGELGDVILNLLQNYQADQELEMLRKLPDYGLTEHQFAQMVGKSKLFQYLPANERKELPELLITDAQINSVSRDYFTDENFGREANGDISLWNLYNLFTSANKSSYIDTFLERNVNVLNFSNGLKDALSGNSNHSWFLS